MYTPLLIVCILSIIAATFGIIYGFGLMGLATMSRSDLESALAATGFGTDSQMLDQMLTLVDLGPWFIVFNIIEIVGVVLLLRMLWPGFHVYAASQIGLAGLMVIAVGFAGALVSIMWNAAWVLIYFNLFRRAEMQSNANDNQGNNQFGGQAGGDNMPSNSNN